ncbi:MAG: signal recognition particle-docking protein FtsY [Nanoarchaeota archaeon]|nr:signal recognition particle-docking protein FtsY [Nanoarchaeota archaeon]
MFGFLKNKLKEAVSRFSRRVDEEVEEKTEEKVEKKIEKSAEPKVEKKIEKKPEVRVEKKTERRVEAKTEKKIEKQEKKEEKKAGETESEDLLAEEIKRKPSEEIILKKEIFDELNLIREQKNKVSEELEQLKQTKSISEKKEDSKKDKILPEKVAKESITKIKKEISQINEEVKEVEEKKGFLSRLFGRKDKAEKEKEHEEQEKKKASEKEDFYGLKKYESEKIKESEVEEQQELPEPATEIVESEDEVKTKKTSVEEIKSKEIFSKESKSNEVQPTSEKKGFFQFITQKITTKTISESKFEELFWDLELAMLENNVAVEVIEKIKTDLKKNLVGVPIQRSKVDETIVYSLRESIESLFDVPEVDLIQKIIDKKQKPFVIVFVGVNGSGKTTTIAKLTKLLLEKKLTVVLGAADTFRAAAIDQLQLHANNLGVKLVKHDYGSDPAAVAFDAIKHAEAAKKDVVMIDTAGRLHSNINLMDEMRKILRVAKPDLTIFIGESITGNDCVEQAKMFNEAAGFDAIVLSKADVDEKGGAAISISYITKKPIMYIGVGQNYTDLKKFDSKLIIESLGF